MESLNEISLQYSIEDSGFAEDLFALFRLKGQGLPSDERLEVMADVYASKSGIMRGIGLMHMRKRKHTLSELTKLALFKSLCLDSEKEPHVAVRRLLQVFRDFSRKRRQAACLSCQFRPKCDFGKQYGDVAADHTRVIDPNFASKVHPACPDLPTISGINHMYEEMMKFQQMNSGTAQGQAVGALTQGGEEYLAELDKMIAEFEQNKEFNEEEDTDLDEDTVDLNYGGDKEDEAENRVPDIGQSGAGKGGPNQPGTYTGKHFAKVSENFVKNLSTASLQLFDLGRRLDEMLKAEIGDKYKPTPEISREQRDKRLTESSEVAKVHSGEHARGDDHFDMKLVKHDLTVHSFAKPEQKKHLLYVLIDESGSMNGQICDGNSHSFLTRGQVACTLAGALCKRIGDDGGMMFLRFFSDGPGHLQSARKKHEFDTMLHRVVNADINGGGTSIMSALRRAHADITSAADEVAKAEILLISDMDDNFSDNDIKWITSAFDKTSPVGKVPLNVLNVNSHGGQYGNAHTVLPKVAAKYLQVNSKSLDIEGIVELVK